MCLITYVVGKKCTPKANKQQTCNNILYCTSTAYSTAKMIIRIYIRQRLIAKCVVSINHLRSYLFKLWAGQQW